MTLAAPTNCWTNAVAAIVAALPECAAFRTLTHTANAVAAAEFVYQKSFSPPERTEYFDLYDLEGLRTFAIVAPPTSNPYTRRRGAGGSYEPSGVVLIFVQRTITPTDATRWRDDQYIEDRVFENAIGDLMLQIPAYVDEHQTLRIRSISAVEATTRVLQSERESEGNMQRALLAIEWGFDGL